jgi:hypothetical protein
MVPGRRLCLAVAIMIGAVGGCQSSAPSQTPQPTRPANETSAHSSVLEVSPSSVATATETATPTELATPTLGPTPGTLPTSGGNPWGPFTTTGLDNRPDPDPLLTPGSLNPDVVQGTIGSTICAPGFTRTIRPSTSYTNHLKIVQIAQYGYTDTALSSYEEDHLISLELGGNPRDPANLWPEPHLAPLPDGTAAGARVKDTFENYLHRAVCNGSLTLEAVQRDIATDWVAAWMAAGQP